MSRKAIGNLIKQGLRKAYKGKTAPLQAASKVANKISPRSKIAAGLAAIASPAVLNETAKRKAPEAKKAQPKKVKEKAPVKAPQKRVQGNAAKRGTYTSRKRTGEGDQGSYSNIMPTMGMPGDDMMSPMPPRSRARRMKAGGLAVKGQGKAFIKSKK
jgi:hypothetical protein